MSGDLIKTILSTMARCHMVRAGDRVGVAVSGGSDSVALLRILHALREQQGILLSVVHFNHGLRGADSDEDERFVVELAAQLGLPLISGWEDVAAIARAKRWNLEDGARRLRYGFFASLVKEGRIDLIAVAHTADDQAETVLARLARGTAPAGLSAIYPVKGHVVRPFIDVRHADLREHLHKSRSGMAGRCHELRLFKAAFAAPPARVADARGRDSTGHRAQFRPVGGIIPAKTKPSGGL